MKNADSANNVRLKLKLYRDNPSTPTPVPAAPAAVVTAPAKVAATGDWGLELKLEELETDEQAEDPGRQGI